MTLSVSKIIPIATIIAVVIIVSIIAYAEIQVLRAQHDRDVERINYLEQENGLLIKTIERANMALERSRIAIEQAIGENNDRLSQIDSVDDDWLMCPLPDGVREAFTNTCRNAASESAGAL